MVDNRELAPEGDAPFLIVIRRDGHEIPTHLPASTVPEVINLLTILARPESHCYAYWMVQPAAPEPLFLAGRYRADVPGVGDRLTHLFMLIPGMPSTATLSAVCHEPVPGQLLDILPADVGAPCVDCLLMAPAARMDSWLRAFVEHALAKRYVRQPANKLVPERMLSEPMRGTL